VPRMVSPSMSLEGGRSGYPREENRPYRRRIRAGVFGHRCVARSTRPRRVHDR
jgi:hypothetical protein